MISTNDILDIMRDGETRIDIDELNHDERLTEQGLDSLDIISLLFALEELFQIKIPEEDIDQGKLNSINSIAEYLNTRISILG